MSLIGAVFGGLAGALSLATVAAEEEPQPPDEPCQKLTGVERTQCERRSQEQAEEAEKDPPPPDTKSEGNEQSDTADPPEA